MINKNNISIISAMASNRVIGNNNTLIWHIPEDLQYFKQKTLNKTVVMGKNTYLSILPFTKGKPFPERTNIVITSTPQEQEGFVFLKRPQDVLELPLKDEVFIIGGGQLYNYFLPHANTLYLTELHKEYDGDTTFPLFNKTEWVEESRIPKIHKDISYDFVVYKRHKE